MKYLQKLLNIVAVSLLFVGLMPTAIYADETITAEIPVTCTTSASVKIEAVTKDAPMPEKDTIEISSDKPGKFVINISVPGTYEYKVYQLPASDKRIQIDNVVYEVSITSYYTSDGKLQSSVVSKSNKTGAKPDKLHFDNKLPANESKNPVKEANTGIDGENLFLKAGTPIAAGILLVVLLIVTGKRKKAAE